MFKPSQVNTRDRLCFHGGYFGSSEKETAAWLLTVYMQIGGNDAWEKFARQEVMDCFRESFFAPTARALYDLTVGIDYLSLDGYLENLGGANFSFTKQFHEAVSRNVHCTTLLIFSFPQLPI